MSSIYSYFFLQIKRRLSRVDYEKRSSYPIYFLFAFVFVCFCLFVFCGVFVVFPNVFLYNLPRLRLSIIAQPILSSRLYTNFQLIGRLSYCCKCLMHNESKPEYWNTRSQPLNCRKSLPRLFEYTSQLEGI